MDDFFKLIVFAWTILFHSAFDWFPCTLMHYILCTVISVHPQSSGPNPYQILINAELACGGIVIYVKR